MKTLIVVLAIAALLFASNPTTNDFADWVTEQVMEESSGRLERLLGSALSEGLVKAATVRQDYLFFSLFTVQTLEEEERYVGFLRRFFIKID